MRLLALLAAGLFAGSLVAADDKKGEKRPKDEEAILGTWKLEKFDTGAKDPVPADELEKVRFVFKKDGKLAMTTADGKDVVQEYKLDPAASPKAIDMVNEGLTVPGVYELDGDTLKVCSRVGLPAPGKKFKRPTELKADGIGVVVMTLKRVKDERKDK